MLLLLEREDAWWAVVRVDGDEDPRVFVSDVAGAAASSVRRAARRRPSDSEDDVAAGHLRRRLGRAGRPRDLARRPAARCARTRPLPMDALAAVAEAAGFAEILDSLR